MKKITRMISLLLLCLTVFLLAGCANLRKPDIEEVITGELDLLKNLDTGTTQKYISYKELFPDAAKSSSIPTEVEEVFSLFFRNFNYKILSLDVEEETAVAKIRLQTIDAQALARDFAAARLAQYITLAADSPNTNDEPNNSLEAHYLLLNKLLKEKEYDTVETNCTMHLIKSKDMWYIQSNRALENELVGGFISYLSDPNLLSVQESVKIYFDTIKNMDETQFIHYLGLSAVLDTDNEEKKELASALLKRVYDHFNYNIVACDDDGFAATVDIELVTLDFNKIMETYDSKLNAYLSTADAVIGGASGRVKKSHELLLNEIQNSHYTTIVTTRVSLVNDGVSWKLKMDDSIGYALFVNLTELPTEAPEAEEESTDTEDTQDSDENDDFE